MTIDTDQLTELLQACTPLPLSVVDNGLERFDILNANGGVVATWLTEDVAIAIVAVMNAAPELIAQFEAMLADHTASHDLRARVEELEADNARLRKQDKGSTHHADCYRQHGHHECAMLVIDQLRAELKKRQPFIED